MYYMSFMFYMDINPPTIFHLEFLMKMDPITPPSPNVLHVLHVLHGHQTIPHMSYMDKNKG